MTPLKIHNCASYALMEYLTCWKCVIFHAVTASCFSIKSICGRQVRFSSSKTPTIMEKINGQTAKNGVVLDTTSNVQPI